MKTMVSQRKERLTSTWEGREKCHGTHSPRDDISRDGKTEHKYWWGCGETGTLVVTGRNVKHSSYVDSYKIKSKDTFSLSQQPPYPQIWKEKLHRKLRCLREWVYLPLKNSTSLRKVVIASKVKSGSQAWGTVGPFGFTGNLGGPPLMRKEIPQWVKRACGNTYRRIFPKRLFSSE